jgi:hypothetical protein
MKELKSVSLGICLLFSIALFSSCSDDEPTPSRIVIDGNGFALDKGYIAESGIDEDDNGTEGRYYTVLLFSPGLDFDEDEDEDFVGEGEFVYLMFFSPSTSEFKEGTYTVDNDDYLVSTFGGIIYEGLDVNNDPEQVYQITSGSITVKKSGDKYTLSFDFKVIYLNAIGNPDVVNVKGQYSGLLNPLD